MRNTRRSNGASGRGRERERERAVVVGEIRAIESRAREPRNKAARDLFTRLVRRTADRTTLIRLARNLPFFSVFLFHPVVPAPPLLDPRDPRPSLSPCRPQDRRPDSDPRVEWPIYASSRVVHPPAESPRESERAGYPCALFRVDGGCARDSE